MTQLIGLAAVAGVFLFIVWIVVQLKGTRRNSGRESLPFQTRRFLLTKAERGFLGPLEAAVGDELRIYAKIRLADVLQVSGAGDRRQAFQNKINSKHLDFVLCSRDEIRPLVAIELDDSSHAKQQRRQRDEFVNAACVAAGLPLLRVPATRTYDPNALHLQVRDALAHAGIPSTA